MGFAFLLLVITNYVVLPFAKMTVVIPDQVWYVFAGVLVTSAAGRSVEKFTAWVWLLGDDHTLKQIESEPYAQYGAPKLKVVCDAYGFGMPTDTALLRMTEGLPCQPGCSEGCGR